MIRWPLLGLVVVLAACDESKTDTSARAAAVEPAAPIAPVTLPFPVPSFDPKLVRPLGTAPAFIAIANLDEITVGRLESGFRAKGASQTPLAQLGPALERVLGGVPASVDPETPLIAHARIPADHGPVDAIALVRPSLDARTLVELFVRVRDRSVALAVNTESPARLPFVFQRRSDGGPQANPMRIAVRQEGIELYGTTLAWSDVERELKELIDNQRRASSMTIVASLALPLQMPTDDLLRLLGYLAANGITEVELTLAAGDEVGAGAPTYHGGAVPTIRIGQPAVTGDLDKAIIRRYIKRNIQKLQYCYEKRLLALPSLTGGTIVTKFTILPTGMVQGTSTAGFDRVVTDCVTGVVGGIEFPKPKGGGVVQVQYPFTFRNDGG